MKRIRNYFMTVFCLMAIINVTLSQTRITIKPSGEEGCDATIRSLTPNTNYGDYPDLSPRAWTNGGNELFTRELLKFDLSEIPEDATIVSAELSMFFNPTSSNGGNHSTMSGSNSLWIKRIILDWEEDIVTWNNQPATTDKNQVSVPPTVEDQQDYLNIDVTNLIKDIKNDYERNFGIMLRLQTESIYRRMVFASSDHEDAALHPGLTVTYIEPNEHCIVLQPGGDEAKDATIRSLTPNTNYGNYPDLSPRAWTNGGSPLTTRELMQFDLSSIPEECVIEKAELYMYYRPGSSNGNGHSNLTGMNTLWISRLTSPWDEQTVTWNTQPSFTAENQIQVRPTKCPTQNCPGIDVTPLIRDILNDPQNSFGFVLRLQEESPYRRMIFASSDYSDQSLHPKLIIYLMKNQTDNHTSIDEIPLTVGPNPTSGVLILQNSNPNEIPVELMNSCGQIIFSRNIKTGQIEFDFSAQPNGVYFLRYQAGSKSKIVKLVKH